MIIIVFVFIKKTKLKTGFENSKMSCKKKYNFSSRSLARLDGVNPLLVDIIKASILCAPYDFGIAWLGGYRTAEQQHTLYMSNTPTKWVTSKDGYIKKSYHQTGNAVDIVIYDENRQITWKPSYFKAVAKHILKVAQEQFNVSLEWGGNWNRKDWGHFQIKTF